MSSHHALMVTIDFKRFIKEILLYKCLFERKTYDKYFDTPASWSIIRQAFIHESLKLQTNYELLEHEGDSVVNNVARAYISLKFPKIVNVSWKSQIGHMLISKKALSEIAIQNGFTKHIAFSDELRKRIEMFDDPTDCRDFLSMNEDVLEALCGAISRICWKISSNPATAFGIGSAACFNLISNFFDQIKISIRYEDIFDAKSRLKRLFDAKGWSTITGCSLNNCLRVYSLEEPREYDAGMMAYRRSLPNNMKPSQMVLETKDRFLVLGYACDPKDPRNKQLLSVSTGNKKAIVEQIVAEEIIDKLRQKGVYVLPTDPYKG